MTSPNKISLIQSVGLLNAAIFSHPLNTAQIKSDLFELIKHILTQAKAKTPNVDLVKKACNLKKMITDLRKKYIQSLRCSKVSTDEQSRSTELQKMLKIFDIMRLLINKTIAGYYKTIMADLGQFCEKVMKKKPV